MSRITTIHANANLSHLFIYHLLFVHVWCNCNPAFTSDVRAAAWLSVRMVSTSVFLIRFWVSKWHPKNLKWHPKFWKPKYGFDLYWSKTIWDKHVFLHVAIVFCNRRLQCCRSTKFSGAEVGSENCKFGICALSCAPPRFGLLIYCRRFVQYGVRNCKSTFMQLWKCFIISPFRSACLAMHQTTMKTISSAAAAAARMQNKVVVEWGNSESWKGDFGVWAALKQLAGNKNNAMSVVLLRLAKTKNSNTVLSKFTVPIHKRETGANEPTTATSLRLFPRKNVCQDATKTIEPKLDDTQCGFRRGRSTKEYISTLQQIFKNSWDDAKDYTRVL